MIWNPEGEHHPDCPFHESKNQDDCACREIAESEFESYRENQMMEEYYVSKHGWSL